MYPDQSKYSIDYLNQIAAPDKKPGMNSKLFMIVLIVGVLVAAIFGIVLFSKAGAGPTDDLTRVAAGMKSLQGVSNGAQTKIQSGKLRTANSNLSLFLSNANRDITGPLESNNIILSKVDKSIIAAEAKTDMIATLEDARLSGIYDSRYAYEMKYQIDLLLVQLNKISSQTKSKSLKEFASTSSANLTPIREQFANYAQSSAID